jgi:hypothetical protein
MQILEASDNGFRRVTSDQVDFSRATEEIGAKFFGGDNDRRYFRVRSLIDTQGSDD